MTGESIKDHFAFQEMAKITGIFAPPKSLSPFSKKRICDDVIKVLKNKSSAEIKIDQYAYKTFV